MSFFLKNLENNSQLVSKLDSLIEGAIRLIFKLLQTGKQIMICDNRGATADSQHMVAECTGRFIKDGPPIAALLLSTDTSAFTCIGNDYYFSEDFSWEFRGLDQEGDGLVGVSTSVNSELAIPEVLAEKDRGIHSVGFLARDGGKVRALCDTSIIVSRYITVSIQEVHILIARSICGEIEVKLGLAL